MAVNDELSADELKAMEEMRNAPAEPEAAPETAAEAPKEPESAPAEGPASTPEPQRDDAGRFQAKTDAAPAPEAKPAEEDKQEKKLVPIDALHEARKHAQEIRREFDTYKGSVEERLKMLSERLAKPAEQPKPVEVEADPIAALKETRQQVQQLTQAQTVQDQRVQIAGHIRAQVDQFKATTPDYAEAYKHLSDGRVAELRAMGVPDHLINQQLQSDEFNLGVQALQSGRNPGQLVYEFAKARGYRKAEPAPAAVPSATPSGQQRLDTIEKGQQAARSLGNAGGAAPDATMTLERLATLSPDDFSKIDDATFRRMMGGR